jgi:PAS domain-containing protein
MEEKHIKHVTELREKVANAIRPWGRIDYIVAEVKALRGASRKVRRMYLNSLKEWDKKHPFKMYIFYSANKFIRTAANLAKPFVHRSFKIEVTKDLDGALRIIQKEKTDGSQPELAQGIKKSDNVSISTKQVQQYVDELLQYLGSINWETDGFDSRIIKTSTHPFSPVFDAIALIKDELDDLFKERRRTEEALKESEEKFRDLVENITDIIYTIDTEGRITYMSPAIEAVLGYQPDEILGRSFFE